MTTLTPAFQTYAPPQTVDPARARIASTAKSFESQFLSVMFGQMFDGVGDKGAFSGGEGEAAFKSFLTDAFAKTVSNHGGVGLAKDVTRSMLKLQGLT